MLTLLGVLMGAWIFTYVVNACAASNAWECAFRNNKNWLMYHIEDDGTNATELIYQHFNALSYKTWFGFRTYFYPFRVPSDCCSRITNNETT